MAITHPLDEGGEGREVESSLGRLGVSTFLGEGSPLSFLLPLHEGVATVPFHLKPQSIISSAVEALFPPSPSSLKKNSKGKLEGTY